MLKRMTVLLILLLLSSLASRATAAGQPGATDTVFNKKFIHKLKPMMPYEQLTSIVGAQGRKVAEDKSSATPTAIYHWDGERSSSLEARVAAGKVVVVRLVSPKGKKFSQGKKGELIELGD
jgi:hypothetical protein